MWAGQLAFAQTYNSTQDFVLIGNLTAASFARNPANGTDVGLPGVGPYDAYTGTLSFTSPSDATQPVFPAASILVNCCYVAPQNAGLGNLQTCTVVLIFSGARGQMLPPGVPILPLGNVVAQGPYFYFNRGSPDGSPAGILAVTGGTGRYQGVTGQITPDPFDQKNFRLVVHLDKLGALTS
ncbi:hypothetical protein WJX72_002977 [[Myrmecia] bisecta]|uniref:Dirigent protein n=1 Tax=[Myrmecia] bisecta TaxID=41462 RepID=A0AAW1PTD3_9CHLO